MAWWLWVLLGLALLVVEILTPRGLLALLFGASALVVAVLAALELTAAWVEWLLFAALGAGLVVALRSRGRAARALRRRPRRRRGLDDRARREDAASRRRSAGPGRPPAGP